MKLAYEDYDQLTVFTVKGEFTVEDVEPFRKVATERIEEFDVRDFVIDCTAMDFIDSKGLETLIWLQDQCAERLGQVRLAACQDNVQKILEITRLAARFDCHDDIDAAVKSLR